jgi:NAD-dependent SIR2 family protein deacetylase
MKLYDKRYISEGFVYNLHAAFSSIVLSAPDPDAVDSKIPETDLPRCKESNCGGMLRPAIVWFGEGLEEKDLTSSGTYTSRS